MYQFFSRLGYQKRQCEWLPIFIVRICLGIFFILSGFFKTFDVTQHDKLLQTLQSAQFPLPELFAYLIPIISLLGGILILIGFLTTFTSFIFIIIMILAIITDRIATITPHAGMMRLENFLYLPEVLFALLFLWLFFSGPGKVSFDNAYGKKKRQSGY